MPHVLTAIPTAPGTTPASDRRPPWRPRPLAAPRTQATDLLPLPEDGKDLTGSFLGA